MKTTLRENIILTGFMGTGKSTVGRLLAQRLGYDFVDTDALIAQRSGRSIPTLFAELGEAAFRQLERQVAARLAQRTGLVIATGGRLMLDADSAAVLGRSGQVYCLVATPAEILQRVLADGDTERPLLAGSDPAARIGALLAERAAGYRQFPQQSTSGLSPEAVVQQLLVQIERKRGERDDA